MRARSLPTVVVALLAACLLAAPVAADPQSTPNGPWIEPEQTVRLDGLTSNEDLGVKLQQIAARSKGRVTVEVAGHTATGWPMYLAKVGDDVDKPAVLIESQIHGGEPFGTEVILDMLQQFATSNNAYIARIRDELTVWFMPRVNMDGAAFEQDGLIVQRRQNVQEWTPQEWGLAADTSAPFNWNLNPYSPGPLDVHGYDLNRDFNADLDFRLDPSNAHLLPGDETGFGFFATPEARTIADVYQQLTPELFIDIHHRGNNTQPGDDDRLTTLQITGEHTSSQPGYPLDPAVRDFGLQVNRYTYDALNAVGTDASPFSAISRYRLNWDVPSSALGSFELNGTAGMLMEIRGQVGQKSNGMLTSQVTRGVTAALSGMATGEVYDVDPQTYFDIPPPGPGASIPN